MRLSTSNKADAIQWIKMLGLACSIQQDVDGADDLMLVSVVEIIILCLDEYVFTVINIVTALLLIGYVKIWFNFSTSFCS